MKITIQYFTVPGRSAYLGERGREDVKITIQYFTGCPNWRLAEQRVRQAMADVGLTGVLDLVAVETPEEAERLGFRGSPTVLIDGCDPFAEEGAPVGLACRLYRTEQGAQGAPTIAQLREVLRG